MLIVFLFVFFFSFDGSSCSRNKQLVVFPMICDIEIRRIIFSGGVTNFENNFNTKHMKPPKFPLSIIWFSDPRSLVNS